jgi:hypothetical protein
MNIDGLDEKPKTNIEPIGIFKLKDKEGRNAVAIDFLKAKRPIADALNMYIVKMRGENNKIKVLIEWKPELPIVKKLEVGDKEVTQTDSKEGISQLTEEKKVKN